jgi:hypothetical protein
MNVLTCGQVDQLLDLYSTGDCAPEENKEVEDHLAACPSCAAALARSNQLLGLLDLHYQMPDRLSRLQERLRREPLVRRHPYKAIGRRVLALAALFLVTLGLSGLLMPGGEDAAGGVNLVASLDWSADMKREMATPAVRAGNPAAFVAQKLTELDLRLTLTNTSARPVRLDLDEGLLQFTLTDPEGHSVGGTLVPKPTPGQVEEMVLKPGQHVEVPISRFTEAGRGVTLERAGEYTLVFRYTTRKQTLTAPPIRFPVGRGH